MNYDFDKIIDRSGTPTLKYGEMQAVFGRSDLIPLWVADMEFQTAQPVIDACVRRAQHGVFGYGTQPESFLAAAVKFEKRRHGWTIDPKTVSYANGVMPSLSELMREFAGEGDGILIQPPVYPSFFHAARSWPGRRLLENRLIETKDGWEVDFADLEEKLGQAKVFVLCNPQNPVGRIWRREELERMASLCLQAGVPMIVDEIHGDFELFGNHYIPTGTLPDALKENIVTCFSATKTFNLAGIQGCCVVFRNPAWKARFDAVWRAYEIDRQNCFALAAMEAAWREGDEWLDQLLPYLGENLQYVANYVGRYLPELRMRLPQATYLAFLDCRALPLREGETLLRFFADEAGVALSDGADFGAPGFMRLNAACPRSTLRRAMEQISGAVARRRK